LQRLTELKAAPETLIFYEAPHRIKATLEALCEVFGADRFAGIGRELTKKFESLYRDTLVNLKEADIPEKGEFVIVVAGAPKIETHSESLSWQSVLETLLKELPLKQAVSLTVQLTGAKKNEVYDFGLEIK